MVDNHWLSQDAKVVTVFNMIAVPCFVYQVTPVYACIESLFWHQCAKILCMQSVAKLSLVQGAVGLLGERLHKLDELWKNPYMFNKVDPTFKSCDQYCLKSEHAPIMTFSPSVLGIQGYSSQLLTCKQWLTIFMQVKASFDCRSFP